MSHQDFGNSGETLEFDPGDAMPCFPVGSEHCWGERCGSVVSRNLVDNLVTIRFHAQFFQSEPEDDGGCTDYEVTDDMRGNVMRKVIARRNAMGMARE